MATESCTLTYVNTYDGGYPDSAAAYHFGYGRAGQKWVTCYKCVLPSFTGNFTKLTINLSVVRGTAYPTNKTSTWKVGLDSLAPAYNAATGYWTSGSGYVGSSYSTTGTYLDTFSGTITTSASSFTLEYTGNSTGLFSSGRTIYIYLYSGASGYNSIKVSSISASLTSGAVTGTNLVIGNSSSSMGTSATILPSNKTLYWGVSGLQYQVKNYTKFYLYLKNELSFTNGQTTAPSATALSTYSSTTNTAYSFTQSFTVPTSKIKIYDPLGGGYPVVAIAQNASGYWRIGGSGNNPVARSVYLDPTDWFKSRINCSVSVTGKNTATITAVHSSSNNPRYLTYVEMSTSPMSQYGTSTYSGTMSGYCTFNSTTSTSTTKTISKTGLTAGKTYTYYPVAYGDTSYCVDRYFGLGQTITFTTDADYTGVSISASVTGSTTATIQCGVSSKINLDGNIYYSTTSGLSSKPSTYVSMGNYYSISKNLTGLTPEQPYTYYFYVYSSASGVLYQIGSVSFTTDAAVGNYTGTLAATATGAQKATFTLTGPSDTTGLNSNWYLSTTNSATTTNLANVTSAIRGSTITLSNLSPASSNTRYAYVYNTSTNTYYQIASITVKTHSYVYYGASLTPCWTYLGQPDGTLQQVIIYPSSS